MGIALPGIPPTVVTRIRRRLRCTDEISHFFDVYKALEPDKYSDTRGWEGAAAAQTEIEACRERYRTTPH